MFNYIFIYIYRYLVAFGPSRHRAWVVGQWPLGRSLGSRGMPLEGFLKTGLRLLGSRFGASWGFCWASWGLLGLLGGSWRPLGSSRGLLGAEGSDFRFVFTLLGPSWGRLGTLLGRLGALLGPLGGLLGRLGAVLGTSWAVLERRKLEKVRTLKTLKSMILASWGPLGPS